MTKEEAKTLWPVIKAFSEGKQVQFKPYLCDWVDIDNIDFEASEDPNDYRVKPESKYRPFKNGKECWNEMLKHQPFGIVGDTKTTELRAFLYLDEEGCTFEGYKDSNFDDAFKDITFADGTPFGIKEEE